MDEKITDVIDYITEELTDTREQISKFREQSYNSYNTMNMINDSMQLERLIGREQALKQVRILLVKGFSKQ